MRAPEGSAGHVDASVYVRFLQDFLTCVRRVENRVRAEDEEPVRFEIARMHASEPTLTLTPVAAGPGRGERVVDACIRTARDLEERGSHPPYVDLPTLQAFRKLAGYVGHGLGAIALSGGEMAATVSRQLERNVDRLLGMVVRSHGSLDGRLEYINAHGGLRCRIYPRVGPTYIECRFPPEMVHEVAAGLKQQVTVVGTLHYYGFHPTPFRIDAEQIVVHPGDAELPDIWDLWGIAPDITDGEPVEAYIRGLRASDG